MALSFSTPGLSKCIAPVEPFRTPGTPYVLAGVLSVGKVTKKRRCRRVAKSVLSSTGRKRKTVAKGKEKRFL